MTLGPQFHDRYPPQEINAAIDSYAERSGAPGNTEAAPYNSESLAEIYSPRVRQLMDLQSQGFTHARWGFDPERRENRWHGHVFESAEVRRQVRQ
jgi:hypothetical protein